MPRPPLRPRLDVEAPFSAPHRRPLLPGTDAPPLASPPLRGEHKWKLLGLLLGGNLAGDAWMPPGSMRYDGDTRSFFFPGADETLPTQTSFGP